MKDEDDLPPQAAKAMQHLRSKLNDEQLDALDELMEYLLSLDDQERQHVCETLAARCDEVIENNKPIN